jgi:general secretion pathway protein G
MTLVELMAVIVILGIIITVVAKNIFGQTDAAKARTNIIRMEKLKSALELYKLEFGRYPARLEDLVRPSADVQRSGKLFMKMAEEEELRDIWNNDFIYRGENDGRAFSLTSLGSDGESGGTDAKQDVTIRSQ